MIKLAKISINVRELVSQFKLMLEPIGAFINAPAPVLEVLPLKALMNKNNKNNKLFNKFQNLQIDQLKNLNKIIKNQNWDLKILLIPHWEQVLDQQYKNLKDVNKNAKPDLANKVMPYAKKQLMIFLNVWKLQKFAWAGLMIIKDHIKMMKFQVLSMNAKVCVDLIKNYPVDSGIYIDVFQLVVKNKN